MVTAAGFAGWAVARNSTPTGAKSAATTTAADHSTGEQRGTGNAAAVSASPADTALDDCRELFGRQVRVALAADAALDQWRLHIQAMNGLVAGELTLAQATKYWEDTRKGAHRNAVAFRRLYAGLRAADVHCTVPPAAATTSRSADSRLIDCRTATSGFADSIAAGRVALATWVHHIHDMNALRAGRISPTQATTMWTNSWHVGARQLKGYDAQAAQALQHDCN